MLFNLRGEIMAGELRISEPFRGLQFVYCDIGPVGAFNAMHDYLNMYEIYADRTAHQALHDWQKEHSIRGNKL